MTLTSILTQNTPRKRIQFYHSIQRNCPQNPNKTPAAIRSIQANSIPRHPTTRNEFHPSLSHKHKEKRGWNQTISHQVRFSPTQITQLHPKPSHHTLPQRTRRRPPNERDDRTNRLHENREDNDRKRPTERANPRRVRGGQGRARGTRVPGSAGASAAARRPTRRSSRRRGMTRMRRRTRSPAWAGTCGEINKPPEIIQEKKNKKKKEERKKPRFFAGWGRRGAPNPAASMAAANGGGRGGRRLVLGLAGRRKRKGNGRPLFPWAWAFNLEAHAKWEPK